MKAVAKFSVVFFLLAAFPIFSAAQRSRGGMHGGLGGGNMGAAHGMGTGMGHGNMGQGSGMGSGGWGSMGRGPGMGSNGGWGSMNQGQGNGSGQNRGSMGQGPGVGSTNNGGTVGQPRTNRSRETWNNRNQRQGFGSRLKQRFFGRHQRQ